MPRRHARDGGFAVPMLFVMVLALLLLAGGAIQVSSSRAALTSEELAQERAFQAAEAGIDHAIWIANSSTLNPGDTFTETLGNNLSYDVEVGNLASDGIDNDRDGSTDEADEVGLSVTSRGQFRTARRRLLAYLREQTVLPNINAVVTCTDPTATVTISGQAFSIAGADKNPDGSPGPGLAVRGVAVSAPASPVALLSSLSLGQKDQITGLGAATPSATVTPPFDLNAFADALKPLAQNVLTPGNYGGGTQLGSIVDNDWKITWCPGSLTLTGMSNGAGILIVDGNLDFSGNAGFTGLVLVKGNVNCSGGGVGQVVHGVAMLDGNLSINGTVDFHYSSVAVARALSMLARWSVTGWREIGR